MVIVRRLPGVPRIPAVQPYTYKDGATLLEEITIIVRKINELVKSNNLIINDLESLREYVDVTARDTRQYVDDSIAEMRQELVSFKAEIIALLEELAPAGVAWNPTNGSLDPVQKILMDLFNYLAVYGEFASQQADNALPAVEQDADPRDARTRAVGMSYPFFNPSLGE